MDEAEKEYTDKEARDWLWRDLLRKGKRPTEPLEEKMKAAYDMGWAAHEFWKQTHP